MEEKEQELLLDIFNELSLNSFDKTKTTTTTTTNNNNNKKKIIITNEMNRNNVKELKKVYEI
jgi:hypothetical protein